MQTLIPILYLLAVATAAYLRPMFGLVLAGGAYLAGALSGPIDGSWISVAGPASAFLFCTFRLIRDRSPRRLRFEFSDVVMALLFACVLASSLYSSYPETSLDYSLRFLFLGLSFYVFGKLAALSYPDIDSVVQDFAWGANIGAISFAIIALAMNSSSSQYFLRLTIGESSAIPLAIYLGQGLVASIILLTARQGSARSLYLAASIPIIGYAFLATNTRSVVLGFVLSLCVLALSATLALRKRAMIGLLAIGALLISGLLYLYTQHPDTIARLVSAFNRVGTGSLGESEDERVVAWSNAWDLFAQSPIIGVGSGSFMEMFGLYPHNALLELGAEVGILGLLLLLALIAKCVTVSIRKSLAGDGRLAAILAFHLAVAMVSMSLWMHKLLFLTIAILLTHGSNQSLRHGKSGSPHEGT